MDIEKLIKILEIKNPTDKIRKHPKMLQLLQYINLHDIYSNVPDEKIIFTENGEEDDVEYPAFDYDNYMYKIKEDTFITLLENINSFEVLLKMLRKHYIKFSLDYSVLEFIKFFSLYDPDVLKYYGPEADILVDEEYLKYASVEWTEEVLKNHPKVLQIKGKKLTLKDNCEPDYNDLYWDSEYDDYHINKFRFELNLVALNKAKKLGLLKEAIKMLSE